MPLPKDKIIKKLILLSFVILPGCCKTQILNNDVPLLYKQLAAQQFIIEHEGFLTKAKHDGVDKKTGKDIYTIGFGTRAKKGDIINYEKAAHDANRYLIRVVYPRLDPSLPINEYVAYASFIYSTSFSHQPSSCEDIMIRRYQEPGTKYENGLITRRTEEYNLCKGVKNEVHTDKTIQRK